MIGRRILRQWCLREDSVERVVSDRHEDVVCAYQRELASRLQPVKALTRTGWFQFKARRRLKHKLPFTGLEGHSIQTGERRNFKARKAEDVATFSPLPEMMRRKQKQPCNFLSVI